MHFCLDIGGTTTRGALFSTDGKILARAMATGAALSLGAEHTADIVREIWQQIEQSMGIKNAQKGKIGIVAGIAGATIPGEAAKLAEILNEFASLRIVSDGYGALIAATQGNPGMLISIGTGLTGMRLFENGECVALSGWGFPIGDQGSGAWLGLCVMQDLTKFHDGIPLSHPISPEFVSQISVLTGNSRLEILNWQKTAKPKDFARLAPTVVEFAKKGDDYCSYLIGCAAHEVADLAQTLLATSSSSCAGDHCEKTIWLSGGLSEPFFPLLELHPSRMNWQFSMAEPLSGLYLLAAQKAPNENIIPRST